jgi:hypothetical protein
MKHRNANGHKRNQLLYREVNKRVREASDAWDSRETLGFLCECGDDDCIVSVELTPAQFDAITRDGAHFLLASHHRGSVEPERVIGAHDGFLVVAA